MGMREYRMRRRIRRKEKQGKEGGGGEGKEVEKGIRIGREVEV